MDVDQGNFEVILPQIKRDIESSDFLSIDLEMTGLTSGKLDKHKAWDTPQQYYEKICDGAVHVCPTQVGITVWKWHAETASYLAPTYNFHIYPREFKWLDRRFTIQASSLEFLSKHSFDFNKWVSKGISWLSMEQFESIEKKLLDTFDKYESRAPITKPAVLTDTEKEWIESIWKYVDEWKLALSMESNNHSSSQETGKESQDRLELGISLVKNSRQRFLLYQEFPKRFPKLVLQSSKDEFDNRILVVRNWTPEQVVQDRIIRRQQLVDEIQSSYGFGRIFEIMINAKKPLIGHNCFLDLALCYHNFIQPLPHDSSEFVEQLHSMFPLVLDTKCIAGYHPYLNGTKFESTSLGNLVDILVEKLPSEDLPKVRFPDTHLRYVLPSKEDLRRKNLKAQNPAGAEPLPLNLEPGATNSAYHEAGFDSLITGYAFLLLNIFYCSGISPLPEDLFAAKSDRADEPKPEFPKKPVSHPILPIHQETSTSNALNLMFTRGTFSLDPEIPHNVISRDNIYLLTGLVPSDEASVIAEAFQAAATAVHIYFESDSQAVLIFEGSPVESDLRSALRKFRLSHNKSIPTLRKYDRPKHTNSAPNNGSFMAYAALTLAGIGAIIVSSYFAVKKLSYSR